MAEEHAKNYSKEKYLKKYQAILENIFVNDENNKHQGSNQNSGQKWSAFIHIPSDICPFPK